MNSLAQHIGAAIMGSLASAAVAGEEPRHVLESNQVRVALEPRPNGMSIALDGVEIIKNSDLIVTTPGWTPHFYVGPTTDAVAQARREPVEGGARLHVTHNGERDAFVGAETITLFDDGRVEQEFTGRLTEEGSEALIQWRIGGINPAIIAGKRFTAVLSSGERIEGRAPVSAASADVNKSTLAQGFKSIEFDSRLGPIRIDVESARNLVVYDYRKSQWADPGDPFFWFWRSRNPVHNWRNRPIPDHLSPSGEH